MTRMVARALQEYETLVKKGAIASFSVTIEDRGILITPAGTGADAQRVPLIEEVADTLHVFFYNVPAIDYGTYDYTSLNSFFHDSGQAM